MTALLRALEMIRSSHITAEQTYLIDRALSLASVDDIPETHLSNVIGYIDLQLTHNAVSHDIKAALDRLHKGLHSRRADV